MDRESNKALLSAAQIRQLEGGISDMALWRRIRDPELGFPKPFYVLRRRFWDPDEYWRYRAVRVQTRDRVMEVA